MKKQALDIMEARQMIVMDFDDRIFDVTFSTEQLSATVRAVVWAGAIFITMQAILFPIFWTSYSDVICLFNLEDDCFQDFGIPKYEIPVEKLFFAQEKRTQAMNQFEQTRDKQVIPLELRQDFRIVDVEDEGTSALSTLHDDKMDYEGLMNLTEDDEGETLLPKPGFNRYIRRAVILRSGEHYFTLHNRLQAEHALQILNALLRIQNQAKGIDELRAYQEYYDEELLRRLSKLLSIDWAHYVNINAETFLDKLEAQDEFDAWVKSEWKYNISSFNLSELNEAVGEEKLKRFFNKVSGLGISSLDDSKLRELNKKTAEMIDKFALNGICPYDNRDCNKDKGMTWALMPGVDSTHSGIDLKVGQYQEKNFRKRFRQWFDEVRPFYEELHAFVRHRLRLHYGSDVVNVSTTIPAHLVGNMWGLDWQNIFPIMNVFESPSFDITDELVRQNITVPEMYRIADEFFVSMGFKSLSEGSPEFFKKSMLQKLKDRKVNCYPQAWDMYASPDIPGDYRIKYCTPRTRNGMEYVLHEMGHVLYFINYVRQPATFRDAANQGFHEALGDTLTLSFMSPRNLKRLRLLPPTADSEDEEMANLLRLALTKIVYFPYSYCVEEFHWRSYDGTVTDHNYNRAWWELCEEYQGLHPPIPRNETYFDAGTTFHLSNDVDSMRYFIAYMMQFHFHQVMCTAAGLYNPKEPDVKPLHTCNLHGNQIAGLKLRLEN
ncbi:unnamed protein product [Notodromas monacha]|uniref:Angiotensin-converting enzyme n=1 Tax=Notodromas monacha TaxID=399045 RepID=A0A7R9BNJ2_9CRUS|nr:unnamed protein product [Notodromas monacha]CAG0918795.1 unnamed protein product [Notodromas monacha]